MFNRHGLDCLKRSRRHERPPILPITLWLRYTIITRIMMQRCERLCRRYFLVPLLSEVLQSNMNLRLSRLPIDRQEPRVSPPPSDWFQVPTSLTTANFPQGSLRPLDIPGRQCLDLPLVHHHRRNRPP
jgi:hypothetical protein